MASGIDLTSLSSYIKFPRSHSHMSPANNVYPAPKLRAILTQPSSADATINHRLVKAHALYLAAPLFVFERREEPLAPCGAPEPAVAGSPPRSQPLSRPHI